jgi:hypothetical protein
MTVMLYKNEEPESQNLTTDWATKLTASGSLGDAANEAEYMIWVSAEYTGSAIDKAAEIKVLLDGNEVAFEAYTPPVANQVRVFNSMGMAHLHGGIHELIMQVRAAAIPNTVRCRRARLLLIKH